MYSLVWSQSSCFVTSSWITWSLGLARLLSSSAPSPALSASRQPANTVKPRPRHTQAHLISARLGVTRVKPWTHVRFEIEPILHRFSSPRRCLASASPKPVSHPVTRTHLSPTSSWTGISIIIVTGCGIITWSADWRTARLAAPGTRMARHQASERPSRERSEARPRLETRARSSLW